MSHRSRVPRWALPVLPALLAALACSSPVGPIPGGHLEGPVHPVSDWAFVRKVETAQLETNPSDPHSVNIWLAERKGALYIATSLIMGAEDPGEREWVQHVLEDPRVRLRVEGRVYELRATRLEASAEREAARKTLILKYDVEADEQVYRAWLFRLERR